MAKFAKMFAWLIVVALIFCLGCEPEPKTETVEPAAKTAQEQIDEALEATAAEEQVETMTEVIVEAEPVAPAPEAPVVKAPVVTESEPLQVGEAVEVTVPKPVITDTDTVAVVNGVEIKQSEVDELIKPRLDQMLAQSQGRPMPDNFEQDTRKQMQPQAVQALIVEELLRQEMAAENIQVTDEEIEAQVAEMAAGQKMTADELKTVVTAQGKTYEQWKKDMRLAMMVGVEKLVEAQGFGTGDVDEAEALEYYNKNKARFEKPDRVRASHILIKPEPGEDVELADAQAKAKAEGLLQEIKDGGDFEQLARDHSGCPSSAKGGDLGYGQLKPRMTWVKPFTDAAFGQDVGQISDLVKTQFGYHIIKTTGREEAGTTSFEEAKDDIIRGLSGQKNQRMIGEYINSLKQKAQITYPEGKEPPAPPMPRPMPPR